MADGARAAWAPPRAHFLIAGEGSDRAAVRGAIERLPVDAYGQVFVEVASGIQVERWPTPRGVSITWLFRDAAAARGRPAVRGALIERAVTAWVAEWMPGPASGREIPYVMWLGCASSTRIDQLCERLAWSFDHVHLHDPRADA